MNCFRVSRPVQALALVIMLALTLGVSLQATGAQEPPLSSADTWHPLAGKSLHVYEHKDSLFVCDFENGPASTSGPQVGPLVAEGQYIPGPFGRAMKATRLTYPGKDLLALDGVYFGFWLRPDFDPATDTAQRVIMQMGDGKQRSLVMRTNGAGKLMLTLSDDDYTSAVRTDISKWKRGEWHHVGGWFHQPGHRMWLMIDGYGVDSTVMYHNDGLREEDLGDLYLGCGPQGGGYCAIDEVHFVKTSARAPIAPAHHDWMLGIAQLSAAGKIEARIAPTPWGVAANTNAVVGTVRTFGLECTLPRRPGVTIKGVTSNKDLESSAPVWTVFNVPDHGGSGYGHIYGVGERIKWSSSDPAIADVQLAKRTIRRVEYDRMVPSASGRFEIKKAGRCTITATMGGRTWTYKLDVIERNRPDLLVRFISRFPRYPIDAVKNKPAPGDKVAFEVNVANRGFAKSTPATLTLRVYESGWPGDIDQRKALLHEATFPLKALDVQETTAIRFPWTWRAEPSHIVATIETPQPEISAHNNERGYLTIRSRNSVMLHDPSSWGIWHDDVNDNVIGTFALEDWMDAHRETWDRLLREAVYPATSPYGVQMRLHLDAMVELDKYTKPDWNEPDGLPGPYWDGGWNCRGSRANYGWTPDVWAPGVHFSFMHEWGHGCFAAVDLYSLVINAPWVHIRDEAGNKVAGTGAFPLSEITGWEQGKFLYSSTARTPAGMNGRYIASAMMDHCGPNLHEAHAGYIQHHSGFRPLKIWHSPRRAIPLLENSLVVLDIEGNPIEGAEIAVYQQSYTPGGGSGTSNFPDSIKFAGKTDAEGHWIYPYHIAASFDDPWTDSVDGLMNDNPETERIEPQLVATPLATPMQAWPGSPGIASNNSMQIIGVRKGPWAEYHVLDSFQFATEALRNNRIWGRYVIQTNIPAGLADVETTPFPTQPAQNPNERPIVVVDKELTVRPGETASIDASGCYDPEGRPVTVYWYLSWLGRGQSDFKKLGGKAEPAIGPVYEFTAPPKPGEVRVWVYCHDTIRPSKSTKITITVAEAGEVPAE